MVSDNSYAKFYQKAIKVNEGIKVINEMISSSSKYKDSYLFPLSKIKKYKESGFIKLGSFDKDGVVFNSVLNDDYATLEKYIDIFDYLGVEPISNLMKLVFTKDSKITYGTLKRVNRKIKDLGTLKNKKVIFVDNAIVTSEEERELAKCYLIAEHIKDKGIKEVGMMKKLYESFSRTRIPYVYSTMEMWKELSEQGFTTEELLEFSSNEKAIFDELPKKKNIVIIPEEMLIPTNEKLKETIKNLCIKRVIELYGKTPPGVVMNRLKKELGIILKNNYEMLFY